MKCFYTVQCLQDIMDMAYIVSEIAYWSDTFIIGHRKGGQNSFWPPQGVAKHRQDKDKKYIITFQKTFH